jgi:threonyl-tRNA synthetase
MDPSKDHRAIGQRLDLFSFHDDAPGMVFWHARGFRLYSSIVEYLRSLLRARGYDEVRTPELCNRSLWEASGHWEAFSAAMYRFQDDERWLALKPVSCPGHLRIFGESTRSYRDLPLRMAEFGCCHRNEPSGSLHGMMRLRQFTQDDAHIFCTRDQVEGEVAAVAALLSEVYRAFDVADVVVRFATRPEGRLGSEAAWDEAEAVLASAARAANLDYLLAPGEGAFYGPKLEFSIRDVFGREWQCGTAQLDLVLPERMGAEYVAPDGSRQRPVMVHRAILGSLERFIAILLEHHEGVLPAWLAPVQIAIAPVSERSVEHADGLERELCAAGMRVVVDRQRDGVARKVVRARQQGIPSLWLVGDREFASGSVSIRDASGRVNAVPRAQAIADAVARAAPPEIPVTRAQAAS